MLSKVEIYRKGDVLTSHRGCNLHPKTENLPIWT